MGERWPLSLLNKHVYTLCSANIPNAVFKRKIIFVMGAWSIIFICLLGIYNNRVNHRAPSTKPDQMESSDVLIDSRPSITSTAHFCALTFANQTKYLNCKQTY